MAMIVEGSFPLKLERTPMPIAMPMGVVTAKAQPSMDFRMKPHGIIAILEPKAKPSKTWWKRMTMNRVMKPESAATTRVKPITVG